MVDRPYNEDLDVQEVQPQTQWKHGYYRSYDPVTIPECKYEIHRMERIEDDPVRGDLETHRLVYSYRLRRWMYLKKLLATMMAESRAASDMQCVK